METSSRSSEALKLRDFGRGYDWNNSQTTSPTIDTSRIKIA
ncbi:hypothetical protein [uncultured Parabacteroides sp.]|nr:hypothetical protein [uncultured Parabacteroides sp.]